MNNTALRAKVQSTNNKHMVFTTRKVKIYFEKFKQIAGSAC